MSSRRIALDPARCPQCQQALSVSEWADQVPLHDIVLQCKTESCPQAAANHQPLTLFTVREHFQPARSEDPCDQITEEAVRIGEVDEDGVVFLDAETAEFRRQFPELTS